MTKHICRNSLSQQWDLHVGVCVRACVRRYACVCLRVARPHRGMQICTLPWKRTPLQNTEQDRWHFNGEVEVDTLSLVTTGISPRVHVFMPVSIRYRF